MKQWGQFVLHYRRTTISEDTSNIVSSRNFPGIDDNTGNILCYASAADFLQEIRKKTNAIFSVDNLYCYVRIVFGFRNR